MERAREATMVDAACYATTCVMAAAGWEVGVVWGVRATIWERRGVSGLDRRVSRRDAREGSVHGTGMEEVGDVPVCHCERM